MYISKIERIALWVAALETADLIDSWVKMKASFPSLPLFASNLESTTLITSSIISGTNRSSRKGAGIQAACSV